LFIRGQPVAEGFLEYRDRSRKGRSYQLAPAYEILVTPSG
jgi:hypothetical protein